MKVLHLLAPARFGGLERVVHALATGQKNNGDEVGAILLLESGVADPSLAAQLDAAGVPTMRVVRPARAFRSQRRALLEICRRATPDVVHTHGYLPDVLAASLRRRFPVALVSTVHGFTGGSWRNRFYEWLQRRSYARFDAVVAVSKQLASELRSSSWSKRSLHTLPNAWSPIASPLARDAARQRLNLQDHTLSVGWVGRISREKGPDVLLEALSLLANLRMHVVFVGEGRERAALEGRARELRVEDRITWTGEVSDAGTLFPAFDVFVNSSRTEGTPITLFEAMAAGVPIVATAVGGVPDVVSRNEAMVIESDNPIALASAIRDIHDSPEKAAARAVRARIRLAKDFAVTPWIAAYERIYREAIAGRNRT